MTLHEHLKNPNRDYLSVFCGCVHNKGAGGVNAMGMAAMDSSAFTPGPHTGRRWHQHTIRTDRAVGLRYDR